MLQQLKTNTKRQPAPKGAEKHQAVKGLHGQAQRLQIQVNLIGSRHLSLSRKRSLVCFVEYTSPDKQSSQTVEQRSEEMPGPEIKRRSRLEISHPNIDFAGDGTKSTTFVENVVRVAVSSIAYLRLGLPESMFSSRSYKGRNFKYLNTLSPSPACQVINQWFAGINDAISKSFLESAEFTVGNRVEETLYRSRTVGLYLCSFYIILVTLKLELWFSGFLVLTVTSNYTSSILDLITIGRSVSWIEFIFYTYKYLQRMRMSQL